MTLKFIFDRLMAFFGLLILWPVLLVLALLVRIKMPGGPVIFRQKRVGKDGKLFTCHKFRTMIVNHGGSTVSVTGDNRITPLVLSCAITSLMNFRDYGMSLWVICRLLVLVQMYPVMPTS